MKRLILWLALLLPFFANAQVNGTIQKTVSTGTIRGNFGSNGLDTLPRVTGVLVNGYILKYHAATNKWYASPDPTYPGLQDSLTKKANKDFSNVASGAIAKSKVDTTATGLQTVSNFFPKGDTRYLRSSQLGTSAISEGGTTNGLSYSNGNFRLHKVNATNGGVLTTGLDTISGIKRFINTPLFNSTYALGQATFGSTGQGAKINFIEGGGGASNGVLGYGSATSGVLTLTNFGQIEISSTNTLGILGLRATGNSGRLQFRTGATQNAEVFSTGNWLLQQGGTFTDAGYKLDVAGTGRYTGNLTANSFIKSGGTGAQFLMGNGTVQDTTTIQTVSNFFPKGDTRYLRSSVASSTYLPLIGGTLTGLLTGTSSTFSSSVSNNYVSNIFNTNTTAGTSFGLFVKAGTNSSDFALNINNAANTIGLFTVKGNGDIVTNMTGGGDRLVSSNNSGLLTGITVGSGLSLSGGTLTATGGSSGSVTTSGGTAGRIAKFTSASNIENSTITESGSDITISGSTTAASFIKSGGTSSQFLKADGSVDANTYLTSSTGVSSITGTANQVIASASTGAVTLSLPQSIATGSTVRFGELGLGVAPLYTFDATKSISSNYVGHIHNTNTSAGTSFGLFVKAGTNSSDFALNINNAANTVNLFQVTGSGNAMVGGDLSFGSSSYRASSTIRRDGANLIISAGTTGFYVNRHDNSASDLFINSAGNIELKGVTATTGSFSGALSASNLSGTNTGDQTTITGNAGTATALQTARNIQGVSFNGTADINPINGTGFVKAIGTTLSYDNTTYAPLNSPTFTGTPTLPTGTIAVTQSPGNNSTAVATTAYVDGLLGYNGISSNTYNPTYTSGTNTSGITGSNAHYLRIGNEVKVQGRASLTASSSGVSNFTISLPFASALTVGNQLLGNATADTNSTNPVLYAETTTDTAVCEFTAVAGASMTIYYSFTYTIIN